MKYKKGVIPPMLTPFDKEGEINREALKEFTNYLIDGGVHALFPAGTIGEFSSMTIEEQKKVIDIVIDETNGRVPVLPGAGSSGTAEALELTKHIKDAGGDGAIIVTPYYLSPGQQGIKKHFEKIASAVEIPIFLYNNPETTGLDMSVDTIVELDQEYSNIVGVKDSSGMITKLQEMKRRTSNEFLPLPGRDLVLLPALLYGCPGGIMGSANIEPSIGVNIVKNYQKGDVEKAREIQMEKLNPLYMACRRYGVFPAGYKRAAELVSGIDLGPTRSPIRSLTDEEEEKLKQELRNLNLL